MAARSQLTMQEYGAAHEDSVPPGTELSKEEIIAKWEQRYERLRASGTRQITELSAEVARLMARVAALEARCEEYGIPADEDGGMSLEDGLAALTSGVVPRKAAAAASRPRSSAMIQLGSSPVAALSGLHTSQNVISIAVAGRITELEDMPVLVVSGGADKRVVASLYRSDKAALTVACSLSLPAPILDISCHPSSLTSGVDDAIIAAGGMDGSISIVRIGVDLKARVAVSEQPPLVATLLESRRDHSKFIMRAKWSPDGTLLATCSNDGAVIVYKVALPGGDIDADGAASATTDFLTKVFSKQFGGEWVPWQQ